MYMEGIISIVVLMGTHIGNVFRCAQVAARRLEEVRAMQNLAIATAQSEQRESAQLSHKGPAMHFLCHPILSYGALFVGILFNRCNCDELRIWRQPSQY